MSELFDTQYNKTAKEFDEFYSNQEAHISTSDFFEQFKKIITKNDSNKKILDLGCGAAADSCFYKDLGLIYNGIDASLQMCTLAKQKYPDLNIRNENFSNILSFRENEFDFIVSKYAIQTAESISLIYNQVIRILKPGGYFIFLVVHPLRQFLEKKKVGKNYFKNEVVESIIFDGKISVFEPTHTLAEYLSSEFLKHFSLINIKEGYDFPASEQINGDFYPTYLIIVAKRK